MNGWTLVSRNVKDFDGTGVSVVNPFDPARCGSRGRARSPRRRPPRSARSGERSAADPVGRAEQVEVGAAGEALPGRWRRPR
ncbi:hypothetical protein OG884_07330 [Streptosporangium sp. NBC_01755]|uniref:hypothetical protein n=1 Tax=unclassified Streptosporangium TaxID=2632669 RepID=UPI002DDC2EF5|nr:MULTISPECIES: hypothetical protein [unclassified Streptosporangium]WSA26847.1 hypothetical protein OIE13_02820 [Streptosporangium sp. NBC_01810]WSD01728.1 hypothetical protein OG884_07330 [Streptosporangium sp. NBC_01755]